MLDTSKTTDRTTIHLEIFFIINYYPHCPSMCYVIFGNVENPRSHEYSVENRNKTIIFFTVLETFMLHPFSVD